MIDFNLTVLWPLTLFALIVLFNSIRGFLSSRTDYRAARERLKGTFETREEGEELLEWGRTRREENWKSKEFILRLPSSRALNLLPASAFGISVP